MAGQGGEDGRAVWLGAARARALEYVALEDLPGAQGSLVSDLGKDEAARGLLTMGLLEAVTVAVLEGDYAGMRKLIEALA